MSSSSLPQERFVVLIARLERRVRSFIAALVSRNPDAIDEVIQSTYLVAWRKLDSFTYHNDTPDEELVRWLCTIARLEVKDFLRRQHAFQIPFDESLIDRIADRHVEFSEYFEARHQALAQCLERLPARQRDILVLRYGQNISIGDLASRLGRQTSAVYAILSRIRKLLERCIRGALHEEGYCS